jgi:FkbM family methyltransferase
VVLERMNAPTRWIPPLLATHRPTQLLGLERDHVMSIHSTGPYRHWLRRLMKSALLRASDRTIQIGARQFNASRLFQSRMIFDFEREHWTDAPYAAALAAKRGAFIDVGANIGQTLIKILSIDAERTYVGFEPQLDCSFYLSQFIKENKLRTHTIFPIGLSNQNAIIPLLKRDDHADLFASTIEGFRPDEFYGTRESIYVARGDDVLSQMELSEISILKIDVEGGELEVIEGMQRTLREELPFVFFEVLNHFIVGIGMDLDEGTIAFRERRNRQLMRFLRDTGYSVFNIRPGEVIREISEFRPEKSDDLSVVDYVATHSSYKEALLKNYLGGVISRQEN